MRRCHLTLWLFLLALTACSGTRFVDYGEGYSQRKQRKAETEKAARPRSPQPPPAHHVVRKGETLYSIAWQYGLDYRTLAARNGIRPPYTIYPGQKLHIRTASPSSRNAKPVTKPPVRPKTKKPPSRTSKSSGKKAVKTVTRWQWPARGKVISRFKAGDPRRQGIDIAARAGTPIRAAAAGKVVYSGNGLRGYGNLVIIKHNDIWFSAYAHNQRIRVRENDAVKAGQHIADMGKTGADRVMLHFEIRHNGKPVDPLRYLPPQG